MPSPGNQFLSDQFGDIEDYFITDYELIDRYIGDTLWVWGYNNDGNLGTNGSDNKSTPVTTFAGGTNWKQVSMVYTNGAGVKTDGTLWTWGQGAFGAVGVNDITTRRTPVTTLLGGTNWKSVTVGYFMIAGIKTDGTLWTWGSNQQGQLGVNNTTDRSTPVTTLLGGNNWKSISCNTNDAIAAIKTDGTLWTWGGNTSGGRLGVNDTTNRLTPVTTLLGGNNWKSVASGSGYTVALKTDGTLWTWGSNSNGQLGVNDTTNRLTPVTTLLGGNNWKSVAGGEGNTIALKTDGTLWTWGRNISGQLGVNDTTTRSTPVTTLLGGNNWKSIAGGNGHTIALKTDGTLWTWGSSSQGRLGVNDAISRSTPVTTLLGGTNWKSVSGGTASAALTAGQAVDFS